MPCTDPASDSSNGTSAEKQVFPLTYQTSNASPVNLADHAEARGMTAWRSVTRGDSRAIVVTEIVPGHGNRPSFHQTELLNVGVGEFLNPLQLRLTCFTLKQMAEPPLDPQVLDYRNPLAFADLSHPCYVP